MPIAEISLNDFGIEPDTEVNASLAFRRLALELEKRNERKNVRITLKPGRYHFRSGGCAEDVYRISNHHQSMTPLRCPLRFEKWENIIFDGCGSELIFHDKMIPFALLETSRCTLKNFSIDYEKPMAHQLKVFRIDRLNGDVFCKVFPETPHRIEDGRIVFTEEDGGEYRISYAYPFHADGSLCWNLKVMRIDAGNLETLPDGTVCFRGGLEADVPEDAVLVMHAPERPTPGIFIHDSKDIRLENIRIHFAFGIGVLAQISENITLDGLKVCRRQGKHDPRVFTTQADATHFSACRGRIVSQNGFYEGMGDDALNVHGIYLAVGRIVSPVSFEASFRHFASWGFEWASPGDRIVFLDSRRMEYGSSISEIRSIESADVNPDGAKKFRITVKDRLPEGIDFSRPTGVENISRNPELIFRKNTVRNTRARGILFTTAGKVLCEDNCFDHVHGAAILICGDCNEWYESGPCREVRICGNHFINNLTAKYQFSNAVISICPEIPELSRNENYLHSNIEIRNNRFDVFDRQLLYAKSAKNISFHHNRIVMNHAFKPYHDTRFAFRFEKTANIRIYDNQYENTENLDRDILLTLPSG